MFCGFNRPISKGDNVLEHREVVTLFHELGHGIHCLVSKTKFWNFHGTNLSIDFGEGPSQMLEKWCWMPSTIKLMSRHYSYLSPEHLKAWEEKSNGKAQPPEKIPDKLIEDLLQYKNIIPTLQLLRLLRLSIFDMLIHQPDSHQAIEEMNFSAEYNKILQELIGMDGPESLGLGDDWGHGYSIFSHLITSDYDAGYYGYL